MSDLTLLSKIKFTSKFSNLSLTANTEKDGSTDDDTLIHNAFVKFFDSKQQQYPEWLGVKLPQNGAPRNAYQPTATNNYANSQFQPVYHNNHSYSNQTRSAPPVMNGNGGEQQEQQQQQSSYTPRSSSRLQDMYNKTRQQSIPGSGYNSSQPSQPTLGRTNTGGRLRERMLYNNNNNNNLQTQSASSGRPASTDGSYNPAGSGSRSTWGK